MGIQKISRRNFAYAEQSAKSTGKTIRSIPSDEDIDNISRESADVQLSVTDRVLYMRGLCGLNMTRPWVEDFMIKLNVS